MDPKIIAIIIVIPIIVFSIVFTAFFSSYMRVKSNTFNTLSTNKVSSHEVFSFNSKFTNGTWLGGTVVTMLDDVVTSNKTNKRQITVKYNDLKSTDSEEIKNIKNQLEKFKYYEIDLDYDKDGFVNLFTITKK